MDTFGLPFSPQFEKYVFEGNSTTNGSNWHCWNRPLGKSQITMFLLGAGGGGKDGAITVSASACGGGGGGSGSQTVVTMPLDLLPPRLYISVGQAKAGNGLNTYVSITPSTTTSGIVAFAGGGEGGGTAAGGGAGGASPYLTDMVLGYGFIVAALPGVAGMSGGNPDYSGVDITVTSSNGVRVTSGAGGGGVQSTIGGLPGGGVPADSGVGVFPALAGGAGGSGATTPPSAGRHGFAIPSAGLFFYGGTGGGSTHGSATGAGLAQAPGGNGAIGCGGGGSGGAITGSTPAASSLGGPGLVIFWVY